MDLINAELIRFGAELTASLPPESPAVPSNPEGQQIGRLAFRQEGNNWNAYYAVPDTMVDAVYLGSVRLAVIEGRPERREKFMSIMRDAVGDILEAKTGQRPSWTGEQSAPEHERTKE